MALALIVAGCSTPPSPTPEASSEPPPTATETARPNPSASESPAPTPASIALPDPGRPFDASALLGIMRDSRRPGGVPDQLEADGIAATLADTIWTFDGRPWTTVSAGGSCGPQTCTLEIGGTRPGMQGDDLWVFSVAPSTGAVDLVSTDLRSVPTELLPPIDDFARWVVSPRTTLDGMVLTSARWVPPEDNHRFVLSYRSGGEEGSCRIEVTLDVEAPELEVTDTTGC